MAEVAIAPETVSDDALATPTESAGVVRSVHPSIEPLYEQLGGLCSLPVIAEKVIQVAEDRTSDAEDLLRVIEQDRAVAARLMKVVNSAYCGLREPVSDLKMAVTMLGVDQVRNLALTVSIGGMFGRDTPAGKLDPERLWDHSICVATVSRMVAQHNGCCSPDEAYLAGLLHDIGLLFINEHLTTLIPRIMVRFQSGMPLQEAERYVMAFDHAQLGAYVVWRSSFPERLVTAIDFHHDPIGCPESGRTLTRVVSVANYLATRYGRGSIEKRRLPAPPESVLDALNLSPPALRQLWDKMPEAVANVSQLTGA